jgi:glutathione S-transferase
MGDENLLEELNKYLETRTFYATNHINIADLAFFGRVYRNMVVM